MIQPQQKPYRSKQDYGTPDAFMRAARARLGIASFAFDFAADATNAKADLWFGMEHDALSLSPDIWREACGDGWGWLNPPFSKIGPWAKRCHETSELGGRLAFLVPAAVGSNWFRDYVDGKSRVLLLNGRIPFMADKPTWLYPKDCILALYGPSVVAGYEVWAWNGRASRMVGAVDPVGETVTD